MRYPDGDLGDTGAAGYLMIGDAPSLHGWPRAIVEAREPLRHAMRAFGYSRFRQARPVPQNRSQAAVCLACAAKSLTLARDLLHTHFAPDRTYASEWAPVIASTQITKALAAEVSWWAWQIAPMAVNLANAGTSRSARFEDVRHRLRVAARSLWMPPRRSTRPFSPTQPRRRISCCCARSRSTRCPHGLSRKELKRSPSCAKGRSAPAWQRGRRPGRLDRPTCVQR